MILVVNKKKCVFFLFFTNFSVFFLFLFSLELSYKEGKEQSREQR